MGFLHRRYFLIHEPIDLLPFEVYAIWFETKTYGKTATGI
jgi:hypothetical protein